MKIRTVSYFFLEAAGNLRRNRSMSMASVGTVTLSLTVLGLLFLLLINLGHIMGSVESKVEMRVFLRDTVTDNEKADLGECISNVVGVVHVEYVNRDKALKRLKGQLGENMDLVKIIGENPLPDSFQVRVRRTAELKDISNVVSTYPGVEDVSYGEEFVDKLATVSRLIWVFTIFSSLALGGAVLFIVVNTIRITLFNRRREIEIMKLVGATDWFIRWPFLVEGAFLGALGATLSIVICLGLYQFAAVKLYASAPFIPFVDPRIVSVRLSAILLCLGVVVGSAGSMISIRKFLRV